MKYLIVNGCSFSAYTYGRNTNLEDRSSKHNFLKSINYTPWPVHLAKKLNMKLINLAIGGSGNNGIYNRTLDLLNYIDHKDIGLVIHMWTESNRRDYEAQETEPHLINPEYKNDLPEKMKKSAYKHGNNNWSPGNYEDWIHNSLRYFYMFQILCENYNIPYVQIQGMNLYWNWWRVTSQDKLNLMNGDFQENENFKTMIPFRERSGDKRTNFTIVKNLHAHNWPYKSKKELIEYLPNNMYYDKIKNFINWPIDKPNNITWNKNDITFSDPPETLKLKCEKYGLEFIQTEIENNIQQRFTNYASRKKTWINSNSDTIGGDSHPNNETHIKIADYIYENL